jgi:hypothetical protein
MTGRFSDVTARPEKSNRFARGFGGLDERVSGFGQLDGKSSPG